MVNPVGSLIKRLRETAGEKQTGLGDATGIIRSRISNIESGIAYPTPSEIAGIARHFENLELIRVYLKDLPTHQATIEICNRMGMEPAEEISICVEQLGNDIINRTQRLIDLCSPLPKNEAKRLDHILLARKEVVVIDSIIEAIRALVFDIKG